MEPYPAPSTFPTSLLDNDLYKFTMQQAVLQHFPSSKVVYRFTNRTKDRKFNRESVEWIADKIGGLSTLSLQPSELSFLRNKCPYFTPLYLDYLSSFRYKPEEQVTLKWTPDPTPSPANSPLSSDTVHEPITFPCRPARGKANGGKTVVGDVGAEEVWGSISLEVKGLWSETIPYEVPLLSIVSEGFFRIVDRDWDFRGQEEQAIGKASKLVSAGCVFSDFGTRRRRSYVAQEIAIKGLIRGDEEAREKGGKGRMTGTSNVHFAHKFDVNPIGTVAHEWPMAIAALWGYKQANLKAMELWEKTYPPSTGLLIYLPDTFSIKPFFEDFLSDPERARRWKGLRQDSGEPEAFIPLAVKAWEKVGLKKGAGLEEKLIVFSDALKVEKCVELKKLCDEQSVGCSFGVGTNFVNDFKTVQNPVTQKGEEVGRGEQPKGQKSKALNIVIKLAEIEGKPCIKISDDLSKNTGDPETIKEVKKLFGLDKYEEREKDALTQVREDVVEDQ